MCLIITILAAVCASAFWYIKDRDNLHKSGILALMYWGAALMWLVDCVFAATSGEAFLDLSIDDTILGVIVVACGFVAYLGNRKLKMFLRSVL